MRGADIVGKARRALSRLELQQKTPPAPGLGHGIEQAGRAPAARGEPAVEARVGFGPPQQRGEALYSPQRPRTLAKI